MDKVNLKKQLILLLVFIGIIFSDLNAQNSINGKKIFNKDSIQDYSFFVSGHFHGSSKNTTGLPARTVRENLNNINNEGTIFLVSLGDLFMDIKNDIPAYRKNLIDKLEMPLFNVPGNHDKSGNLYEENFGVTFYYFSINTELYIFLDTELEDGSILGEQMRMLKEALKITTGIRNIFVFTHRLIWAEEHPNMKHLFTDNTRSNGGNNFRNEILPLIEKNAHGKNVYFMGGSLGNAPSPFFFHKEKNIFYIATAIRDTPKDAFLKVEIINSEVKFSAFPLIMPIEFYDLDYYNGKHQKEPGFNWRLVPLYIKNMLLHRYFWYGIISFGLPLLSMYLWRKFRRK